PRLPFLEVTITTPCAPRDPHSAVEAASLRTVIDSMSLGFIVESTLNPPVTGTPSITMSALELFWLDEPIPRIRIPISKPGCPSTEETCRPGTAPSSVFVSEELDWAAIVRGSTVLMEPVRSFFFMVPYATTTTSSREAISSVKATLITVLPATGILCDSNPINEKTNVDPSGTVKEYLPLRDRKSV